jgi:Uma2 family endonuclease
MPPRRKANGKALVALTRSDYEPGLNFFAEAQAEAFEADQWKFPAPDSRVEVLSSSMEQNDRGVKLEDYAAHGVREYWIVDPEAKTVEQFALEGDGYELIIKSGSGEIESRVVEGFAVPVRALFDDALNLEVLRETLQA